MLAGDLPGVGMRCTPLSPQLQTVGARPLERLSTLSLRPATPATSPAWQPGICRDWAGRGRRQRRGSLVNMQWGDSATPRSRPLPNDPSLPSHPVSCNSPETLALTTRARGGSGTGRSRGADCLGRWEAVSSCWTSLEAV